MSIRSISALVVATGSGALMRSSRPKSIHLLCGRSMASYVLDTMAETGVRQAVLVTGGESGRVKKRLLEDSPPFPVQFMEHRPDEAGAQTLLVGLSGFDDFNDEEDVLIVPADLPLLRAETLFELLEHHRTSGAACTVLTVMADDGDPLNTPGGTGIIDRDRHGRVCGVTPRSQADRPKSLAPFRPGASEAGITIDDLEPVNPEPLEAATGIYCVRRGLLAPSLRRCVEESITGNARISDLVGVLAETGHRCESIVVSSGSDLVPVDNRSELAEAEAELRWRTNQRWLARGVTMVDPARTYIDATVKLGTDITIFPGTILQGSTVINDGCEIGPEVQLDRCTVGPNTRIDRATAKHATIGADCIVGPFAALVPGTDLPARTVTGPFYYSNAS